MWSVPVIKCRYAAVAARCCECWEAVDVMELLVMKKRSREET
jgi:hypothetical protein